MTEQEKLEAKTKIEQFFETQFEAYKADCEGKDREQVIGRDYGPNLPTEAKIQDDFDRDARGLELQNNDDQRKFESWMKEQRATLRADEIKQTPQKAQPRLVPSSERGSSSGPSNSVQIDKDHTENEKIRDAKAKEIQKRFDAFQEQRHEQRFKALNDCDADNKDKIVEATRAQKQEEPKPLTELDRAKHELQLVQVSFENRNNPDMESTYMASMRKRGGETDADYEERMQKDIAAARKRVEELEKNQPDEQKKTLEHRR